MRTLLNLGCCLAAMAAGASGLSAQGGQTLSVPLTKSGDLSPRDSKTATDQPFDEYPVRIAAGQRVRASATSTDFDTVIEIRSQGEAGPEDEPIVANDDSGQGLNSEIIFSPEADGTYLLRVLTFDATGGGKYELKVQKLEPLPPPLTASPSATKAMEWATYDGSLAADDPENSGVHFDDYAISFEAGKETLVRLESGDFDAVVRVLGTTRRDGPELAGSDDGGGGASGTDSLLFWTPETGGSYIVRVTSYGAATGNYRLHIGR